MDPLFNGESGPRIRNQNPLIQRILESNCICIHHITIQEDYEDWRKIKGIQLEGTVTLVDSLGEKAKAMAAYARKYPEIIKLFTNPTSGGLYKAFLKVRFYCVVPERIFYIDNEQGFGKREELVVTE